MKIGFFGNCQAAAIGRILQEHLQEDDLIIFKPIHTMNEAERIDFLKRVGSLDVLIHQPISDVYKPISTAKILEEINSDTQSILFPVLYFSPYFMDMTYIKDKDGGTVRDFISDYHSRIIISAVCHGLGYEHVEKAFFSDNFFPKDLVINNLKSSIEEIKKRESSCDVEVSDLYLNYDKANLFFTFNHPTGHILFPVIDRILTNIGRPSLLPESKVKFSRVLGNVHWHSVTSVHNALELKFTKVPNFNAKGKVFNLGDFYEISKSFYNNNPHLIELNMDRILPKEYFVG